MSERLEQTLAARYLLRLKARPAQIHLITLALFVVAATAQGSYFYVSRAPQPFLGPQLIESVLRWTALGGWLSVALIGFLVLVLRHLTIFSAISTFGLYLGSAALVVVLSVMSGFEQDLKQKILGANAHVLVTTSARAFDDYAIVDGKLRQLGLGQLTQYISAEVMVSSQSNLSGVILKGIDPATAGQVTDLAKNLEQGSLDHLAHPEKLHGLGGPGIDLLDPELPRDLFAPLARDGGVLDARAATAPPKEGERPAGRDGTTGKPIPAGRRVLPGLLIGRELAKNLRLYVGDDVNMISPLGDIGPHGPMPRSRPFRVAGIFYSGMYEYDTKYVYAAIPAAQKFLGQGDEITGFELRIARPDESEAAVEKIQRALGAGYDVQDWKELNRGLFSALKVEKVAMFIVLCFIILVAGFSIVANGVMLIREKRRDIAILKSMGATDGTIMRTFLYIGFYMGLLGVLTGIVAGIIACLLLGRFGIPIESDVYYISRLPVRLNPGEIAAVFAAAMGIVVATTIYPALAAAHLRPVDGLRYDQG